MKKISVIGLVLALVLSMNVFGVMGDVMETTDNLWTVSVVETGTYKVTVSDKNEMGFFLINDANGETTDYVIIQGNDYGYIYYSNDSKGYTYAIQNVNLELVSTEDLGVSGYHVFEIVEGERGFDPLIDEDKESAVVDCSNYSEEELDIMFS